MAENNLAKYIVVWIIVVALIFAPGLWTDNLTTHAYAALAPNVGLALGIWLAN